MGCGCAKRMSKSRRKKQASKKDGNVIRKRRVSRLIAVPGKSSVRKIAATETTETTEEP
jgi:hypothetical protein